MAGAASIRILPVQCPSPFRLSHGFGGTPSGPEAEPTLSVLANSKTERRGEHANALAPDQKAGTLLRDPAAPDNSQRGNPGRALIGLELSYGAMGAAVRRP